MIQLNDIYKILDFIPKGDTMTISEIQKMVESNYQLTEDDKKPYIDYFKTKRKSNYPYWKHMIQKALYYKKREGTVTSLHRGTYVFNNNPDEQQIVNKIEELNTSHEFGYDQTMLIKIRVNQSAFRAKLLFRYKKCYICGISNQSCLCASHIKPWKDSSPVEKLDIDNGLLLCANHDRLFDRGLITFDGKGKIMISNKLSSTDHKLLNIDSNLIIQLLGNTGKYMKYHRDNVFE